MVQQGKGQEAFSAQEVVQFNIDKQLIASLSAERFACTNHQ